MQDQYASFAHDYDWLFDDEALDLGTWTSGVEAALRRLPREARILDAACGTGVDALALSRRGLRVCASDASAAMARRARRRFADAGHSIPTETCCWSDLPARFGREFDAVICTGNSLAHAPDTDALALAATGFRNVLADDGRLIVDTHNWELVHEAGSRVVADPDVVRRDGTQCARLYVWRASDTFDAPHVLDVVLVFTRHDKVSTTTHRVVMHPFAHDRLTEILAGAGFVDIATNYQPGADHYTAVACRA